MWWRSSWSRPIPPKHNLRLLGFYGGPQTTKGGHMKKQILIAFSMLSLIVVLTAISVSAQSNHYLVVTIPFEFAVRGKTLPPGEYIVKRRSSDKPEMLSIVKLDGPKAEVTILTINV